jgi:hypothetical protein
MGPQLYFLFSESFPADPPTIVKILKNRGSKNPEIIGIGSFINWHVLLGRL